MVIKINLNRRTENINTDFSLHLQQGNTRVIDGEEWEEVPRKNTRIYSNPTFNLESKKTMQSSSNKSNSSYCSCGWSLPLSKRKSDHLRNMYRLFNGCFMNLNSFERYWHKGTSTIKVHGLWVSSRSQGHDKMVARGQGKLLKSFYYYWFWLVQCVHCLSM